MSKLEELSKSRLKYLHRLKLKKYRHKEGLFLIEGERLIQTALASGWAVEEVYLAAKTVDSFLKSKLGRNLAQRGMPLFSAGSEAIESLSETETPQGVVGLVRQKSCDPADFDWGEVSLCVILDGLKDPGNLGTIIRTAHGFGVGAVFLTKGCVEVFNPKVVRATMGSLFYVPVLGEASLSAVNLIKILKDKDFKVVACDPDGDTAINRMRCRGRVCLLVGSEPSGVSQRLRRSADISVRIPTMPTLESLNVATACAIFLYEISRQRSLLREERGCL